VRNALVYVLANSRKHAQRTLRAGVDPCSSGAWFDGWRGRSPARARDHPCRNVTRDHCPRAARPIRATRRARANPTTSLRGRGSRRLAGDDTGCSG
jgi:hypothetical protein